MTARAEWDRGHSQSDYAGILLHDGTASVAETELALRHVHFVDIHVVNDPALVSRLVPTPLRQDASSWLVLYGLQDASSVAGPYDVLILPFPDGHTVVASTVDRSLAYVAFRLVEVIRGSITSQWTPVLGLQNIPQLENQGIHVPRFQLIHSDAPLFDLQESPSTLVDTVVSVEAAIEEAIREASMVKSQQSASIRSEEARGDRQSSEAAARLARINHQLYERIRDSGGEVVVPAIVEKFKGVMDPQTSQFLISAATVTSFVERHPSVSHQFDYSLPGSALCKAVEREAKRSIRWFLGKKLKNIRFVDVESTLKDSAELAERLDHLLDVELCEAVVGAHDDDLPGQLAKIRKCRNSVAHIDVASHEQYAKLLRLVLAPVEEPERSTLGVILRWKKKEMAEGIAL